MYLRIGNAKYIICQNKISWQKIPEKHEDSCFLKSCYIYRLHIFKFQVMSNNCISIWYSSPQLHQTLHFSPRQSAH